jgi:hypothetical protein
MKKEIREIIEKTAGALSALKATLEAALELDLDKIEAEQPTHQYQGAYNFVFKRTYNGILDVFDLGAMNKAWIREVELIKPTTREMSQGGGGFSFWVKRGGIVIRQSSEAHQAFRAIRANAYDKAAKRALEERKAAKWSGVNFLTMPDGTQKGPNGQYFDVFARP